MTLLNNEMDEDARAERVLAALDKTEAEEAAKLPAEQAAEAPPAQQNSVEEAETAPETPASGDEKKAPEPEIPAIEPPKFLKAEYRESWKSLPTDWQRYLATKEEEDTKAIQTKLNEAATQRQQAETARKAAEDKLASTALEQQRYAQQIAQLAQHVESFDPIIAQYSKTDLQKLAKENPAEYVALDAAYRDRMNALQTMRNEQARAASEAATVAFQREEKALLEKMPELADQAIGHKFINELREGVVASYGFRPEEVKVIPDHRYVLMARDALAYQKLKAEHEALKTQVDLDKAAAAKALAEKKVAQPAQRVVRPNPSDVNGQQSGNERDKALIKQAGKARSLADKAAILAELTDR